MEQTYSGTGLIGLIGVQYRSDELDRFQHTLEI
jgi:hypothetical protein